MTQTIAEANKRLVLKASYTLFNKRDYNAAVRFGSPNYIQHRAHIARPGRPVQADPKRAGGSAIQGRADLGQRRVRDRPRQVLGHWAAANWIAADIVRIAEGSS